MIPQKDLLPYVNPKASTYQGDYFMGLDPIREGSFLALRFPAYFSAP